MRHHVHCQDLNGVIGYYPPISQNVNTKSEMYRHEYSTGLNTDHMVYKNTQVTLGGMSSINDYNKNHLDTVEYA